MTQKRTSRNRAAAPLRVVIVTLDGHLAPVVADAERSLRRDLPGMQLSLHAAALWNSNTGALERCREDLRQADVIIANMLFMEEHINAVRDVLEARREDCAAMVVCLAEQSVCQLTRMGSLDMASSDSGGLAWLKKLRPKKTPKNANGAGAKQMAMLRRLPQILRFVPGPAQDLRMYFLTMQYWLAGSQENIANMVRALVNKYVDGACAKKLKFEPPIQYPEVGLYHPRVAGRTTTALADVPTANGKACAGTVGLLVMRSYVLADNTEHYDGVINALESRGLRVLPAFSSGLDARAAIDEFFQKDGAATVDAIVSLTGFSLVGGPAYNDADAAVTRLQELDVPYITAQALEFQSLEDWRDNEQGLLPIEAMMMVAIPELDGATGTMIYGGREQETGSEADGGLKLSSLPERASMLAARVARLIALRRQAAAERKVAIVLYDFPPNSGATGSAAYLDVFASLHVLLQRLAAEGYDVEAPETAAELQALILGGNAERHGTAANVCDVLPLATYIERNRYLETVEQDWGPAPGRILSNGRDLLVQGVRLGNVLIGIQPPTGCEGDPMRLMFEGGIGPNHAMCGFYDYLKHDFRSDVVLHFGMHGSLEFLPGKQAGLDETCWPDRLIGDVPHVYLYAANNPSEAALAKRRTQATVITHMTPPLAEAGLFQELQVLKDLVVQTSDAKTESDYDTAILNMIREQADKLELLPKDAALWSAPRDALRQVLDDLNEVEQTLIPTGLQVLGQPFPEERRADLIKARARELAAPVGADDSLRLARGEHTNDDDPQLVRFADDLASNGELDALVHALQGGYIPPVAGGDLLRNPDVLPTGRNIHGFDPSRLPTATAVTEGRRQAEVLLNALDELPQSIAMVLWGTDALKNGGVAISQALALMGARPRYDAYGRLAGAELIPLEELGRPRVDVLITISGIFRDLLPKQIQLLAEAALLCAQADEAEQMNPIRAHVLDSCAQHDVSLETAALRVFGNAESAYGANVNHLVDSGRWQDEAELGDLFTQRRSFAYGMNSRSEKRSDLFNHALANVELTYQNLDSVELGVTSLDHYVDSLGGISRAARNARGQDVPTFVGDHTHGEGAVRSLVDQVALETRSRVLNPRWYQAMLEHGTEGVNQIESHVTNTVGWSATTGQVEPWVYQEISKTYMLDEEMRERLMDLNPKASVKMVNRLVEAQERKYWSPDKETLEALLRAGAMLEDRLEGVG